MTPYLVTLRNTTPAAAGAVLANMVKTRQDAKRYLDDVNDSAHYPARVLVELVCEAFALTPNEAEAVYREWAGEVE